MPKRYTVRDMLRIVQRDGWYIVAQAGSHRQFKHDEKPGRDTIAGKEGDTIAGKEGDTLHPKTAGSILRQAGLDS